MRHEKSGVIIKYSKIFVQKQVFCAIFSEKREAAVQRRQTWMRGAGGAHVKTVEFTEFSDKKLKFVFCRCILFAGFLPNEKGAYEFQNIFMGFIDRYFSAAGGRLCRRNTVPQQWQAVSLALSRHTASFNSFGFDIK